MPDKWHEWETPWRSFLVDGTPHRMKIQYGLDSVNDPPVFHFQPEVEEKLRNNRWSRGWGRGAENGPDVADVFPELSFASIWDGYRPSHEPMYLPNAKYWWEDANGVREQGLLDARKDSDGAARNFNNEVVMGAIPGDDAGIVHRPWPEVEAWILKRNPYLLEAFEEAHARMPVELEGHGQQESLRLLPPGVRRVMKGNQERIQAALHARHYGNVLWDKMLGCGHYGCVFPIEDSDRVLKISTDATEGPVIQAIMDTDLDTELPGLIEWHEVWQIPDYEGRGARERAYAIVRDSVEPFDGNLMSAYWLEPLNAYNRATQRSLKLKNPRLIEMESELAVQALQKLYNWNETTAIAEAIDVLREHDIILSDVHRGNLGIGAKSPNPETLLIFDPGHSKAPPTQVKMLP